MGSKSPTLPSALKVFFTNVLLSLMGASSASSAQLTEKCSVTASHLSQSKSLCCPLTFMARSATRRAASRTVSPISCCEVDVCWSYPHSEQNLGSSGRSRPQFLQYGAMLQLYL